MSIPPEVVFDRFFRSDRLSFQARAQYSGKLDLDRLDPGLRSLLTKIQTAFNEALENQDGVLPDGRQPMFHFDYVEATVLNALAFEHEGYCFIGITEPLIRRLLQTCEYLGQSTTVAGLLMSSPEEDQHAATLTALFTNQLNFIVGHEYSHHCLGHPCRPDSTVEFLNEIPSGRDVGSLESQVREAEADGLAVYFVLTHMLIGERRDAVLGLLDLEGAPVGLADQSLLSSFILAVGAFFYVFPPGPVSSETLYQLTHPPYAARMSLLMDKIQTWCRQNRPDLESWLTLQRFRQLMRGVEEATWSLTNGTNWAAQTAFFFATDAGAQYFRLVHERIVARIQHDHSNASPQPS